MSQMSEFSSGRSEKQMCARVEASALVKRVAEPRECGDSVKAAILRAARRLGFAVSRTKDIWYEDARRIDAREMDTLRRAAAEARSEAAGRAEALVAVERLMASHRALSAVDADFHRETLAAIERSLGLMGCDLGALAVRGDQE